VIPIPDQKFPIQHYKVASPSELVEWEGDSTKQSETGKPSDLAALPTNVDTLAQILRSQAVCAWGECYHKRKFNVS
jgi:hypothetical protein